MRKVGIAVILLAFSLLPLGCSERVSGRSSAEAARLGMGLMDPTIPWNDEIRAELGLPTSVFSRDEAIKHFLCGVADQGPDESDKLFLVGRYFLLEDCEQAAHYLRLYLERSEAADTEAMELLALVESSGCEVAANWLREQEAWPD